MQSHHLQAAHYPCLLKLHFVAITNYGKSVCDDISGDVAAYIGRSVMNYTLNFNLVFNKITCAFLGEQITLLVNFTFKFCKSVHHRTIQINHQPGAKISQVSYPDVYLQLNVLRAFSRQSSGAQRLQWLPLQSLSS